VRKEAAWAVSNMTSSGTPQQMRHLVQQNAVPALVSLLASSDLATVRVALDGLDHLLSASYGSDEVSLGVVHQITSSPHGDMVQELSGRGDVSHNINSHAQTMLAKMASIQQKEMDNRPGLRRQ